MKNYKKGFGHVLLLIVIAVIVIIGGLYFIGITTQDQTTLSNNDSNLTSQQYVDKCLSNTGKDETVAGGLGVHNTKQLFQDQCYLSTASIYKDVTHCEKIVDPKNKSLCVAIVSNNPKFCETITDKKTREKDMCYHSFAVAYADQNYCKNIPAGNNPALLYDCNSAVAVQKGDVKGCDLIVGDNARKYTCVALITKDPAQCAKTHEAIYGTTYEDMCLIQVARATNNKSLCSKVQERSSRQVCELYLK
jgi:hypothetical protein